MEEELIGWQVGSYSKILAICAIAVFPVIIWFLKNRVSRGSTLLGIYVICLFLKGSVDLIGINSTITRFILEGVALGIFFATVKRQWPGVIWLIIFIFASLVSLVLPGSRSNIVLFILFLMQYLELPLLFIALVNMQFDAREQNLLTRLIVYLCVSQIFASIIKFFIIGISEPYIGTMSVHEGGITTFFSLAGFALAMGVYFINHKNKFLWAALGFVIFAIVGAKRASVFYIPLMYIITLLFYKYMGNRRVHISRYMISGLLLVPILFYFMARINPSFNPEQKVWGAFDLAYILDYSDAYLGGEMDSNQVYQSIGRGNAFAYIHQQMNSGKLLHMLMGNGAGELIQSAFNANIILTNNSTELYTLKQYGVGYGFAPGYLRLLVQVGYIGTFSYVFFFVAILFQLLSRNKILFRRSISRYAQAIALCSIVCCFIILFIFIQYSNSAIILNAAGFAVVWFISRGYCLVDNLPIN